MTLIKNIGERGIFVGGITLKRKRSMAYGLGTFRCRFHSEERGAIFVNAAKRGYQKKVPSRIHVHYLYFSVLCGSLNATCSIRKCRRQASDRRCVARIFIFHFNLHFKPVQHTSPGKVGHSCGIHRARPTGGTGEIYICCWSVE